MSAMMLGTIGKEAFVIEVIGAPFNSAGTADGVARAPAALRRAGLVTALESVADEVVDRGDLPIAPATPRRDPETRVIAVEALAPMIRSVRDAVGRAVDRGHFPLVLGGDCPVLLGCLAAAERNVARVLYIDGHEDAWKPEESTTGEAADMDLGWLLGLGVEKLPAVLRDEIPRAAPDNVIVLGARDQDELADAGVRSIDDTVRVVRVDAIVRDPAAVARYAVESMDRQGPWWLHVDLDVLSTDSLAAVDYRQPGGLDWPTLTELTATALAGAGVLGWSVTIYNPDLDPTGDDARRIVQYIAEALGSSH
jgi:arginase